MKMKDLIKKKRILLIDDCRSETQVKRRVDVIARNYWEGMKMLKLMGPWDVLLIDHDLNSFENPADGKTEKTGYDIMLFLEEMAVDGRVEYIPSEIICVSSNPAGRKNIEAAVNSINKRRK